MWLCKSVCKCDMWMLWQFPPESAVGVPFKIKMFLMHERFLMERTEPNRNEMKANGLEVNQPAKDDNDNVPIARGGDRRTPILGLRHMANRTHEAVRICFWPASVASPLVTMVDFEVPTKSAG